MEHLTRRQALVALGLGALVAGPDGSGGIGSVSCGIGGCPLGYGVETAGADDASRGRLVARPGAPSPGAVSRSGSRRIGTGGARDGLVYVPEGLTGPAPLAVLLHGATGSADGITRLVNAQALADEMKLVILAPDSRGRTWDMIGGRFGPDVVFLDAALALLFAMVAIDPKRVAIGGFSDGASFALSLGLSNGDLFTHVVAFSPGFFTVHEPRAGARLFVSHGQQDAVLPIDSTSRRMVPALKRAGYDVRYREFNGPHAVPPAIAREAFEWLAGKG